MQFYMMIRTSQTFMKLMEKFSARFAGSIGESLSKPKLRSVHV